LKTPPKDLRKFSSLLEIVEALRSEQGCPWDKEQTHRSLAPFAIEEAFELAEAIENADRQEMISELGDLLLQVALHSEIARQSPEPFTIDDVVLSINEKMVRRHPHVFSDTQVANSDHVLQNWADIKALEKKLKAAKPKAPSFEIPAHLPSLMRAQKIGVKTKAHQFDWHLASEVVAKVEEELTELKEAIETREKNSDPTAQNQLELAIEHELGDLLFSTAQLSRHLKLDAEQALRVANQRFEGRFFKMLELAGITHGSEHKPTQQQLEALWDQVKQLEKRVESDSLKK
jgi:tetrapyrrole methylase family protein/MazG family protein